MRRLIYPFLVATVLISSVFAGMALAQEEPDVPSPPPSTGPYLGNGYFPTADLQWHYDYSGTVSDEGGRYYDHGYNAIVKWRDRTDLNVYRSSSWDILLKAVDFGSTALGGKAYICNTGGVCYDYNRTYRNCIAKLNTRVMRTKGPYYREGAMSHELGHCWSLNHRGSSSTTSIMYEYGPHTTPDGRFIYAPDGDDVYS
jgi:hypothetical protein